MKKFGLPERYMLYVGIIDNRKNVERFILAFSQFAKKDPDIYLVIAGRTDDPDYSLEEILEKSGCKNRILQIGFVPDEDLPNLYAGAELFGFVSLYEGFGRPVIEAMACGTPVVISDVTSLPEIAGEAAILVDPYDTESVAQGIEIGIKDKELRNKLVDAGIKRAARFSNKNFAKGMIDFYTEVEGEQ